MPGKLSMSILSFVLEDDAHAQLHWLAGDTGKSVRELLREAIVMVTARYGDAPPPSLEHLLHDDDRQYLIRCGAIERPSLRVVL